jgi:hypothetical protein
MRGMRLLTSLLALPALVLAVPGAAQTRSLAQSGFQVHVIVPRSPTPFIADGRAPLAYELRVTNIRPAPVKVTGVDVLDGAGRLAG